MESVDLPEAIDWTAGSLKVWDAPVDVSVKISAAASFHQITGAIFTMVPSDPHFDIIVGWLKHAALVLFPVFIFQLSDRIIQFINRPANLIAIIMNLLHTRSDLEGQRLWISTAHQIVGFYCRSTEVH